MKRKNGFTLIELLAIIVILAIIAVITVPIILNIIETSKKGAAQDSAYGYKDAVNKWYVSKLQEDNKYTLNGGYTISEGKLNDIEIPLSGDKPTSGNLHYTNSILDGGCLTIGEYKVTFDKKGNASNTEKGECEGTPTIPTCPGCVYAVHTGTPIHYGLNGTGDVITGVKENYKEVVEEYGKNIFLGLILDDDSRIERAFACGIHKNETTNKETPFCIEGTMDGSKREENIALATSDEMWGDTCAPDSSNPNFLACEGPVGVAIHNTSGEVVALEGSNDCIVDSYGYVSCHIQ